MILLHKDIIIYSGMSLSEVIHKSFDTTLLHQVWKFLDTHKLNVAFYSKTNIILNLVDNKVFNKK